MFYCERQRMASQAATSQNCLVHRVSGYPMVALGLNHAASAYEWTKAMRVVGATIQMAENAAVSAYHVAEPRLEKPINLLTEYGISALDKLEKVVPAVKKQPNEIWLDSIEYYNDSRAKTGVDTAKSIKDATIQKVSDTKRYCTDAAVHTFVEIPQSAIQQSVHYSTLALDALLRGADDLVDHYIVVPNPDDDDTDYNTTASSSDSLDRTKSILNKAATGVRSRTSSQIEALRSLVADSTKQMETALLLMDYAKAQQQWASATVQMAQGEVTKLYNAISEKAKFYGKQPDTFILDSSRQLSSGLNHITQTLAGYSASHLPGTLAKSVESAAQYTESFSETLAQAETLGQVRTDVIQAMKDNFEHVQSAVSSALNSLTEKIPSDWVPFLQSQSSMPTDASTSTSPPPPYSDSEPSTENAEEEEEEEEEDFLEEEEKFPEEPDSPTWENGELIMNN